MPNESNVQTARAPRRPEEMRSKYEGRFHGLGIGTYRPRQVTTVIPVKAASYDKSD